MSARITKPAVKRDFPSKIRILLFSVVILAAGTLVYVKTISYDYVYCDDNKFVVDQYPFNKNISNVLTSFRNTLGTTFYRPILTTSFIIDANIGGLNPGAYHRTNVIIHLFGSCLVFFTLLIMGYPDIVSCLFSLFFTIHPVLTPAVAWIPGRNDSLTAIFILLSFLSFIRFLKSNKWPHFVLHIIFFAISLFTKEIALVFPAICLLFITLYKKEKLISKRNLFFIFIWIAVATTWFVMRSAATANIENPDTIGLIALANNCFSVAAFIGKIFLPVKMIALSNIESFSLISGIVFMALITAMIIGLKKLDKSKALFGASWFLLFILPTLFIRIANVEDFFDYAEHRMYLPLLGMIIVMVEIFRALKINFKKRTPLAIASAILLIYALRSYSYQSVFENRKTFWAHTVEIYPFKSRGYLNLGKVYFLEKDLDKAESLYLRGLELNPHNFDFYLDLSALNLQKNKLGPAEEFAKKAISLDSNNSMAHFYLGKSYLAGNQFAQAIPELEKACDGNHRFPNWFFDLGNAYYWMGQPEKAIQAYEKELTLNPNHSTAQANMGTAFAALQKFREAESAWIKAISLDPKNFDSYRNLLRYYMQTNRLEKIVEYVNALKRNGGQVTPDIQQYLETKKLKY
jgi:protein O-mannosyl-transferase